MFAKCSCGNKAFQAIIILLQELDMKEAEGVEVMAVDGGEWAVAQGVAEETRLRRNQNVFVCSSYLLLEL